MPSPIPKSFFVDFLGDYEYKIAGIYKNTSTPVEVICKNGHLFKPNMNSLLKCLKAGRTGCKECCGKKKYTIEKVRKMVERKGFSLISEEYVGNTQLLEMRCKNKHLFKTRIYDLNAGIGCSECYFDKTRFTYGLVKKKIEEKGFELLSKKYRNADGRLTIKCDKGHVNITSWHSFNSKKAYNNGCFRCLKHKSEDLCRKIFEKETGKIFVKIRPTWLRNPETGSLLELDGHCEELKLAFEYDGEQHFKPIDFFGGEESFISRVKRDLVKNELCEKHGIMLIRIPYSIKDIENHIKGILNIINIKERRKCLIG